MMSDLEAQEPLSNLSDCSFVILSQGSLPPQENDIVSMIQSKKAPVLDSLSNSRSTLSAFESTKSSVDEKTNDKLFDGSNVSESSIQKKLNELVKENYQLKETLNQNNLAIKSQLDQFFMWQQEVLKTHETHKQKFLETKDLILKLRSKNLRLQKQLEDSLPGFSFVNGDQDNSEAHKEPENLDELLQKIKEYGKMCSDLTSKNENLQLENERLKKESETIKNENLELHQMLENLQRENQFLKDKSHNSFDSKSYKSLPNSEARAQISNLLKQLEEEKAKVTRLKEELQKCQPNIELSLAEQLNTCLDKLNDMNTSQDIKNQRLSSLQSWVSLAEENLKKNQNNEGVDCSVISEIQELKSELNEEKTLSTEKQESLEQLKEQYNKLSEDYETLQSQLQSVKNNESLIEKHKEEISDLLSKLEMKDKELISKQQECDDLNEIIKKLNLECEEIAILRVQAQQFQADFNEERAEREKLAEKKEEMAEQIRYFQMRLQTLERNNSNENASTSSPLETPGQRSHYLCPRCSFSFSDLKVCEEHINQCLSLEFQT